MRIVSTGLLFFFFAVCFQLAADEEANQQSLNAAEQWLQVVDKGEYGKSWQMGALTFKLTISQSLWKQLMKAMREPLGQVVSRKLLEQRPAVNPKGLPAGHYMVVFFKAKFQNKEDARELVTLVHESDGQWRVLTYQVQ